ncbi:MAG TPA: hypothetical protein VIW70_05275 [Rubrivivax sp.]
MKSQWLKKSQTALGVAVICVLFLVETSLADRAFPSPLSPFIWAALSIAGVLAVVAYFWCRTQARRVEDRE